MTARRSNEMLTDDERCDHDELVASDVNRPSIKDIPIPSACPKCGAQHVQYGQDQDELIQMLRTGDAIPASCMLCDEHWEMSIEERANIARALNT